jgi:oligosaccharyltransferase complex subunit alpha (ribophorin I)
LRTIDLTKPYVRETTALVLENTSNMTQTEYYWGIPHNLVPKLSYLEVKERKTTATTLFAVEVTQDIHP